MDPCKRPSRDSYFMALAFLVSERSTCLRRKVGAVLVADGRVLSTGYNGSPRDMAHCKDVGCLRERLGVVSGTRHELCRGVHAEQNAIIQAAISGVSTRDAVLYSTTFPCVLCTKLLINSGVCEVVYCGDYQDSLAKELMQSSGIVVRMVDEPDPVLLDLDGGLL